MTHPILLSCLNLHHVERIEIATGEGGDFEWTTVKFFGAHGSQVSVAAFSDDGLATILDLRGRQEAEADYAREDRNA